jgi:hypothetical protein
VNYQFHHNDKRNKIKEEIYKKDFIGVGSLILKNEIKKEEELGMGGSCL